MPWKYVLCVPKLLTMDTYGRWFLSIWLIIVDGDGHFIARRWLWWVENSYLVEMMPLLMMMGDDGCTYWNPFGGCLWAFLQKTSHVFSEPGSQEAAKWRCGGWESIRSCSLYRAVGWFDMISTKVFFADFRPMFERWFPSFEPKHLRSSSFVMRDANKKWL